MTTYLLLTSTQNLSKKPIEVNDLQGRVCEGENKTKQISNKRIFAVALVEMIMLWIISPCDFTIRS